MNSEAESDADVIADAALMEAIQSELSAAVDAAIDPWLVATVARFLRGPVPGTDAAVASCRSEVGAQLERLFSVPVEEQWTTPLVILRSAGRFPTDLLEAAGVAPIHRDPFDQRRQPDDIYGVAPATWADLGPEVAEAGLRWGAAKAHLHLRARARLDRRTATERDSPKEEGDPT